MIGRPLALALLLVGDEITPIDVIAQETRWELAPGKVSWRYLYAVLVDLTRRHR